MTLVMTLVTPHGVWASTDHRLTEHPSGKTIPGSSVKHVVLRCRDGAALVSYTGLGRVGRLDVSAWMRGVLRGENRTVDETFIDLREQATARFGPQALAVGVPHTFLAGAFLGGRPWAVEIRNLEPPNAISTGGLQPRFKTAAVRADTPLLLAGGAGRDAVLSQDRELLKRVSSRKPRRPKDFMRLLADVNRRAAENAHPAARTISRGCTVVFMPPSGDGVTQEWYGPEDERHLAPLGDSVMLFGVDLSEIGQALTEQWQATQDGSATQEDFDRRTEEAARRMVQSRGRRSPRLG